MKATKVAIVHDWLYGGGAELVVEELHKLYPEAPIYTSYCTDEWRKRLNNKVVTGYLQNTPFAQLRKFLPILRQYWFKSLDLSNFDLVISSSGNGGAKFAQVKKPALHICYCHTPTHFYWRKYDQYLANPGFRPKWLVKLGLKLLLKPLRKRDYKAARRVDYFIANSSHIQHDIEKFYHKESTVIFPPVNVEAFNSPKALDTVRSGFIIWGRHVPYKRFDLAIKACNELELPLIVVGSGPETAALKKIAGPTVSFAGRVSDEELISLASTAEAFLFPGEEDFGIAPVEALAAGTPVIAYESGGALDYVIPGRTGIFFKEQTTESLMAAIGKFKKSVFTSAEIARSASRFSSVEFQKQTAEYIKKATSN